MTCDELRPLISAYADGELDGADRDRVRRHLDECDACRREYDATVELKEELDMIRFTEPTDAELDRYWKSVYNRLERGVGWAMFSLGTVALLCYGGFRLVEAVIRDPQLAWWVKGGVVAAVFGLAILLVSVARERLAVRKADRYSREVQR